MKPFIAGIFALFLFAMASGMYVAFRDAEGLVETNYFERGNGWFRAKSEERRLGLVIGNPKSLVSGSNELKFTLTEHGKPLSKAQVKLFFGSVSSRALDFSCPTRETEPGVYEARAVVPSRGKWLVRMDLISDPLKTSRSWFYDVR
jgi:hypothetical protein